MEKLSYSQIFEYLTGGLSQALVWDILKAGLPGLAIMAIGLVLAVIIKKLFKSAFVSSLIFLGGLILGGFVAMNFITDAALPFIKEFEGKRQQYLEKRHHGGTAKVLIGRKEGIDDEGNEYCCRADLNNVKVEFEFTETILDSLEFIHSYFGLDTAYITAGNRGLHTITLALVRWGKRDWRISEYPTYHEQMQSALAEERNRIESALLNRDSKKLRDYLAMLQKDIPFDSWYPRQFGHYGFTLWDHAYLLHDRIKSEHDSAVATLQANRDGFWDFDVYIPDISLGNSGKKRFEGTFWTETDHFLNPFQTEYLDYRDLHQAQFRD
ncbi:MAG: hypothetical protein P8P30_11090 [Rickettsiales bacterium]|nr:hypothetical protein [Rickettsiales bacterium]